MDKYELNDDERLIMELLDGNLDEEAQQLAFQKLAYNPALQDDFLDYISIDKLAEQDASNISVPIQFTNDIFAKISDMQPLANGYFTKIKRGLTIGIFAMLMLLPLFFVMNSNTQSNQTNENISQVNQQQPLNSSLGNNQNIAINKNVQISNQDNKLKNQNTSKNIISEGKKSNDIHLIKEISRNDQVSVLKTMNQNEAFVQSRQPEIESTNDKSAIIALAAINNSQKVEFSILNKTEFSQIENQGMDLQNFKISKREFPPIMIQYHVNSAITNPVRSMQKSSSVFSNYGVSVFFETFPNISFGAEFGSEPFSQIFLNSSASAEYQQAPDVFYLGIAGKYDANQLSFLNIHPVAQIFVGGSSLGPLTRLSVSMEYTGISKYFGIYGGVESGFLLYSNQGKWLSSKKVGAIIGANIKF